LRFKIIFLSFCFIFINADEINFAKLAKLTAKGKKVAELFCDKSKLPKAIGNVSSVMEKIKQSNACSNLNNKNLKALAYYLINGDIKTNSKHLNVPKNAKCPVCGMFVAKYPKWAALIKVEGKKYYFDGVKDLMKFYLFDGDFKYDRSKIKEFKVTNFYTLQTIDAKDAFYVIDSKILGPMGNELIPFSTKKEAQNFIKDHGGKIIKFKDITPKLVMGLDGIEFNK
jgi:nitrous oxide reductase accessory protein NosL